MDGERHEVTEMKFGYKSGLTVSVEYNPKSSKLSLIEYILPKEKKERVSGIWKEECPQDLLPIKNEGKKAKDTVEIKEERQSYEEAETS